jgi:hypothetical protein
MQKRCADTILQRIAQEWRAFVRRQTQPNEFDGCDSHEIERIAHDLGLSAAELRAIAARDENADLLLRRRMADLRLDPHAVDPAVMRDLERVCAGCQAEVQCEHDLDTEPQRASWPSYCPNSATLQALTDKKPH